MENATGPRCGFFPGNATRAGLKLKGLNEMGSYAEYSTDQRHVASQSYIAVPVIERIRQWIDRFPAGELITTTVRQLSEDIGVGRPAWGSITPALKRLQHDGHIAYTASREGTIIQRLGIDRPFDQCFQTPNPQTALECESGDRAVDQSVGRQAIDRNLDQPSCMEDHDLIQQEEEKSALERGSIFANDPRYQELLNLGADETIANDIFENKPPGWTIANITAQIGYCESRPDKYSSPRGYVFGTWRHGREVILPRARSGPPPAKRNAPATEHCYDAPPATNAEADAAARRAYVFAVAPDADDDTIGFVLDCHDRGLSVDEARVELEAAYVGT